MMHSIPLCLRCSERWVLALQYSGLTQKLRGFGANFIERLKQYAVGQDRMEIPAR